MPRTKTVQRATRSRRPRTRDSQPDVGPVQAQEEREAKLYDAGEHDGYASAAWDVVHALESAWIEQDASVRASAARRLAEAAGALIASLTPEERSRSFLPDSRDVVSFAIPFLLLVHEERERIRAYTDSLIGTNGTSTKKAG